MDMDREQVKMSDEKKNFLDMDSQVSIVVLSAKKNDYFMSFHPMSLIKANQNIQMMIIVWGTIPQLDLEIVLWL